MEQFRSLTILIPHYNQIKFLKTALNSALVSGMHGAKIIVVDDGSDENQVIASREVMSSYLSHQIIFECDGENLGISGRLNKTLPLIETEFFIILAADDFFDSSGLENLFSGVTDEVDFVWGNLELVDEDGNLLGIQRPIHTWQASAALKYLDGGNPYSDLLRFNNFISGGMTLMRTSAVRALGGWDESVTTEDYDFWLRASGTCRFKYVNKLVGYYRTVPTSKSRKFEHKLSDNVLLLKKHVGESKEIDRGIAHIAAMRWAYTAFKIKRIPKLGLRQMSIELGLSKNTLIFALPKAVLEPVILGILSRFRRTQE